ncbi:hypothetical protein AYI69_g10322 [Smittium culicis]|uniref:Uncharacterized protein n=1 Tax=Smittium culicis TaxID=133412 RepID=A0A1R1X6J3_9FUNG|nr:hypothetical protein AYI69_g10322 [Smittium culicis]
MIVAVIGDNSLWARNIFQNIIVDRSYFVLVPGDSPSGENSLNPPFKDRGILLTVSRDYSNNSNKSEKM